MAEADGVDNFFVEKVLAELKDSPPPMDNNKYEMKKLSSNNEDKPVVTVAPKLQTDPLKIISTVSQRLPPPSRPSGQQARIIVVQCGICEEKFDGKPPLDNHIKKFHPELSKLYILSPQPRCLKCLSTFNSCKSMITHIASLEAFCNQKPSNETINALANKLRICSVCKKAYSNIEDALICVFNHPISCLVCLLCLKEIPPFRNDEGKQRQKQCLLQHVKIYHSTTAENGAFLFSCPNCDKKCDNVKQLKEHLINSHYDPCIRKLVNGSSSTAP